MPTELQTVAGGAEFDGTAGNGLFSFADYNAMARTSRITINWVAYSSIVGADPVDEVTVWAVRPGGTDSERVLMAHGLAPSIVNAEPRAAFKVCPGMLPRDAGDGGQHWNLIVLTVGKEVTASAIVDFSIELVPED